MRSAELQAHWDRLGQMGCVVCQLRPVQLHHAGGGSIKRAGIHKAKGRKNSDWLALPLCAAHHTGQAGIHSLGVETWEGVFGYQTDFLTTLGKICGLWLLGKAEQEKPPQRTYKRPSKVMAR